MKLELFESNNKEDIILGFLTYSHEDILYYIEIHRNRRWNEDIWMYRDDLNFPLIVIRTKKGDYFVGNRAFGILGHPHDYLKENAKIAEVRDFR